jgi:hypothetical protein
MGGRISNKVSPMKEYGRKPYLVTPTTVPLGEEADYRYMMDKTWQKAQDDAHIVVQSVKKKPYQEQDYQSMENTADGYTNIDWHFNGKWYRPKPNWRFGKTNTVEPIPPTDPVREEERRVDGVLKWVQCPTTVSASKSYTIIVRNSYRITLQYTNGRLRNTQTETIPTQISLVPKTSEAKGLSIAYVKDMGGSTRATLQTTSYATGFYYIYGTDGANSIHSTIRVASSSESTIVLKNGTTYYKLRDVIDGSPKGYTVFTVGTGFLIPTGYSILQTVTSVAITSTHTQQSILRQITLLTGEYLCSIGMLTDFYTAGSPSQVASGTDYATGGNGKIILIYKTSAVNYEDQGMWSYEYYAKYPDNSLIVITTDAQRGSYPDLVRNGHFVTSIYYIDSLSFIVGGWRFNQESLYSYWYSGMFSGASFGFYNTTNYTHNILFGSI